jgi:outer membrane protein assembly factor BamE (lipoprotein component of BamABCDE complex)
MRRFAIAAAFCLAAIAAGCASRSGGSAAPPPAAQAIPANSPLATVKVGMTAQEVTNVLGMPTNQVSYASGKAWIPFYYGDDARRTEWSYKGLGRVVFTGGNVFGGGGGHVERVDYDPTETGIRTN